MSIGLAVGLHLGGTRRGAGAALPTPASSFVAGVGDSITKAGLSNNPTDPYPNFQLTDGGGVGSYFVFASLLPRTGQTAGDGKFRPYRIHATGGFTAQQIYQTHVQAGSGGILDQSPLPGVVVYLAGANDLATINQSGAGFSQANLNTTMGWITLGWDTLLAAGVLVFACQVLPNNSAVNQPSIAPLNAAIVAAAAARGMTVLDFFIPLASGGVGPGYAVGMFTADGIHPTTTAAKIIGQVALDAVWPHLPQPPPELATTLNERSTHFRWLNATMRLDADSDGIPDGGEPPILDLDPWVFTANGTTLSLAPRTGFSGNAWHLAKASDPGDTQLTTTGGAAIEPTLTDGDAMRLGFVAEVPSWTVNTSLIVEGYKTTDSTIKPLRLNLRTDGVFTDPILPFLWAQDFTVPASFGRLRLGMTFGGTGTNTGDAYLGQLTVEDLTTLAYVVDSQGVQVVDSAARLVIR